MKKIIMALCLVCLGAGAYAQKGEKAVGVNLSYPFTSQQLGIGVKGQYGITDPIRAEFSGNYFLKKDGCSMWDLNLNAHYLFDVAEGVKVYPLAGLSLLGSTTSGSYSDYDYDLSGYAKASDYDDSDSSANFGINLGGGAQYSLTPNICIGAELKYHIISNFNELVLSIGATYSF